ncbi:MAG TPA: hypothetical protein VK838_05760, partial [Candidatus Limnocylindrales bacterium]|nr:hypothetical protein [Candidatus Limnocylindrales bacterium]
MQRTQSLSANRAVRVDVARVGLPALAGAMLLAAALFATIRLATPSDGAAGAYVTSSWSASGLTIEPLTGEANGLRSGDLVASVAGRPLSEWLSGAFDRSLPRPSFVSGSVLPYELQRAGSSVSLGVPLADFPLLQILLANWSTLAWAIAMAAVGIYLYWRRPEEPATRAMLLLGTGVLASSLPWMIGLGPADMVAGGPAPLLYLLATFPVYSLFWSAGLHFALVFPGPVARAPVQSRLVQLAYGIPIAAQLAWMAGTLPASENATAWIGRWTLAQLVIVPVVILAILGVLLLQWRRA